MISPEAQRFAELLSSTPKMAEMALADQRIAGEHAEDLVAEPNDVTYAPVEDHGVRGLWAAPSAATDAAAVLYMFGGGHVISSVASRRKFAGHLARAVGARVLIIDYPLAPEHPFPADVLATTAAYRWLLCQGLEPCRIAVAGESSGAGLVLSTLIALRDACQLPAAAYLISPWADLTCAGASFDSRADVDLEVTRERLRRMAAQYLNGRDPADPAASPLLADLSGLPPLLIQVGGYEVLLDDAFAVAQQAAIAGCRATLDIWPGMQHCFPLGVGIYPEALAALTRAAQWLANLIGTSSSGASLPAAGSGPTL